MQQRKIIFISHSPIGKTNLIRSFLGASQNITYIPTIGVEVHPIIHQGYVYNIWDTASNVKYGGLRDGYYLNADMAIVFIKNDIPTKAELNLGEIFKNICPDKEVLYIRIDKINKDILFNLIENKMYKPKLTPLYSKYYKCDIEIRTY